MNAFTLGPLALVATSLLAACGKSPSVEERAAKACRTYASTYLVDPVSARYSEIEVRHGSGTSYWDVHFVVQGKDQAGGEHSERATCRLEDDLDLIAIVRD